MWASLQKSTLPEAVLSSPMTQALEPSHWGTGRTSSKAWTRAAMPEMSDEGGGAKDAVMGMTDIKESHRAEAGDPVTGMVVNPSTPVARSARYAVGLFIQRMGWRGGWQTNT